MQINRRRTPLVLMELIITILFLAVVSALCTQIFLKSFQVREDTDKYNTAVQMCSSVVELIINDNGNLDSLKEVYPGGFADANTYTIERDNYTRILASVTPGDNQTDIIVVFKDDLKGEDIYEITTTCYTGGNANEK